MPHFFAPSHDGQVTIVGDDARHLTQSLRSRPGQTISVIDPAGRIIEVRLTKVGTEQVVGEVISDSPYNPEPAMAATVALAMLPASALEDALSHCTELGAFEFILVETQRSVVRRTPGQMRLERWNRICREAAMLAGRLHVPSIRGPMQFSNVLQMDPVVRLLDRSATVPLAPPLVPGPLTLMIGPEGGWTPHELGLAGSDRLFHLGPRNLRAETAAVAALATILVPG